MRARWLAVAVASAFLLSGCSSGSTATVGGDDALAIGVTAEPKNFDFATTDGAAIPQALLYNVYEGLVKLDANGEIAPLLAESWTISPDRTVYDFRLRSGVTFSNGCAVHRRRRQVLHRARPYRVDDLAEVHNGCRRPRGGGEPHTRARGAEGAEQLVAVRHDHAAWRDVRPGRRRRSREPAHRHLAASLSSRDRAPTRRRRPGSCS